jgi:tripartite-type tricarboxylate transporter receptor subunit TctC
VLSSSKHDRLTSVPFDKLRVNGNSLLLEGIKAENFCNIEDHFPKEDIMSKKVLFSVLAIGVSFMLISSITAAEAPFYEGKTVTMLVGGSPGGGYDTYARVVARHMGKYIPGTPPIIVENMPAAAGMMAANTLFKVSKPDGLTIGHLLGSLFLRQVLGLPGNEFDAPKFEFIGAPAKSYPVCVVTKASGITSVEKWMSSKTPIKMGAQMPLADPDNVIRVLKAALGLPIQIVSGYKGTAEIRLAAESGEVSGSAWGWESLKVTWRKGLESGDVIPVLQVVGKPLPDLPKVPLAISFARTDEAKQQVENLQLTSVFLRPFAVPPGTPADRVEVLRKAFAETVKDKDFLAETAKAQLAIDPVSGVELEKAVQGIFKTDPAALARFKETLLAK